MSENPPEPQHDTSSSQSARSIPYLAGALGGAAAYLIGYLITYLWKAQQYRDIFAQIQPIVELFGGQTPPPWKIIGWLYHSAHFIESRVTVGPVTTYVDLVAQGGGNLEILYILPPLLLLLAGLLVARQIENQDTIVESAQSGASVVFGYVAFVLVGVIVFQVNGSGQELVPSLLLAGIAYPLVFGAVGGVIAYYTFH